MTKRILTLLLALVLVLTLGACTNKKPNDEIPSGDERVVADFDGLKAEIDFLIVHKVHAEHFYHRISRQI